MFARIYLQLLRVFGLSIGSVFIGLSTDGASSTSWRRCGSASVCAAVRCRGVAQSNMFRFWLHSFNDLDVVHAVEPPLFDDV